MAQAFGRLIRRADDKGVFVMLDAATPTRLFASLPPGTEVLRMGLVEAIELSKGGECFSRREKDRLQASNSISTLFADRSAAPWNAASMLLPSGSSRKAA
jgi:hypothetical protein